MRMLVVEDNQESFREFEAAVEALDLPIQITVVSSRLAACELLPQAEFDFVICDLHIPAEPGAEPALEHGLAVYECAAKELPGTPTILMTGSGDQRPARERIAARPAADIFGVGEPYAMTDLIYKHEPQEYTERIADVARQLEALNAIQIHAGEADLRLTDAQARALRIFARRHHAKRVDVVDLGGLSDALAVRATLLTEDGSFIAAVFAKLAPLDEIALEADRYRTAAVRLPAGSYAPLLDTVTAGAGRTGGLFYGLADRHQQTLFGHLQEHPETGGDVVDTLRDVLGAWRESDHEHEEVLVTTLRRERVASGDLEPFTSDLGSAWQEFEKRTTPIRRSLQHGDLHGGNVLIGESATPLLIDFGNVGQLASCFDPVVLELSLVFHPDSPFREGRWPSVEQCRVWDDLDEYVRDCPAPDFVRRCRAWALEVGATPMSVYAVAYAEVLRQLHWTPDDGERAIAIADAAARAGLAQAGAPAP